MVVRTPEGKTVTMVVFAGDLSELLDDATLMADPAFMESVRRGIAQAQRGELLEWEAVKRELAARRAGVG